MQIEVRIKGNSEHYQFKNKKDIKQFFPEYYPKTHKPRQFGEIPRLRQKNNPSASLPSKMIGAVATIDALTASTFYVLYKFAPQIHNETAATATILGGILLGTVAIKATEMGISDYVQYLRTRS